MIIIRERKMGNSRNIAWWRNWCWSWGRSRCGYWNSDGYIGLVSWIDGHWGIHGRNVRDWSVDNWCIRGLWIGNRCIRYRLIGDLSPSKGDQGC